MKVNLTRAIREYQYVRFSCDAIGNPYEITWKWYRNEDLLENQTRNYMDIPSIRRTFNGDTISCEATNSVGSTKKTFLLNVECKCYCLKPLCSIFTLYHFAEWDIH